MSLKNKLNQLIDSLIVDLSQQKEKTSRKKEFRVSSFPYCPIRQFLFDGGKTESYSMDFYTSIGTAVHETLQKWVTKGGFKDKVWACWKVVETGEIIGPCFQDEIPSKYSNYTITYEEVTILYNGLSGHVDLIIEIMPGKFIVIDFKTTDLQGTKRKNRFEWRSKYPASNKSIIQISTYSTLLKELFNIDIVAWCLIYIDRGSTIQTNKDFHKVLVPWKNSKHQHTLDYINQACNNNKRLIKLQKLIDRSNGFNPNALKLLKSIVVNRPCVDVESYNEWMDYAFHKGYVRKDSDDSMGVKNGNCVLKEQCLSGSKDCYRAVMSSLNNNETGE